MTDGPTGIIPEALRDAERLVDEIDRLAFRRERVAAVARRLMLAKGINPPADLTDLLRRHGGG